MVAKWCDQVMRLSDQRLQWADLVRLGLDATSYLEGLDPQPSRLPLFFWGPPTGAAFIGHQLKATAPEIQLSKEERGVYKPSTILT